MVAVGYGTTFIVTEFDVAGELLAHAAFEVIITVIASLFTNDDVV